ncbi:delta-like protein 1, partial [Copidosoma floridanum]|uniref:delta-like protein 1 n=1 Tax=Copidosoma floridanum TaxID=29053 RepID=UPI000C6FBB6F
CRLGWQGPMCKQCAILPGCVHGTCHGPLECRCEPGWTGFLCSTPICSAGCSREHGGCRRPNSCRCRVGYTGPNCTECVPYPGCANGSCRKPWECRCKPGWTGELCDERLTYCDDHPGICLNNATCISMTPDDADYRCVCPLGFYGRQCEKKTEFPATDLVPPTPVDQPWGSSMSSPSLTTPSSSSSNVMADVTTEETIEPLGPIVITDPPSTVAEASHTAGKWPPEPPTESPPQHLDAENET